MIRFILRLYMVLLGIQFILSFLPQYQDQQWAQQLKRLTEASCRHVRHFLPPGSPFDFSPLIIIVLIEIFIRIF